MATLRQYYSSCKTKILLTLCYLLCFQQLANTFLLWMRILGMMLCLPKNDLLVKTTVMWWGWDAASQRLITSSWSSVNPLNSYSYPPLCWSKHLVTLKSIFLEDQGLLSIKMQQMSRDSTRGLWEICPHLCNNYISDVPSKAF